MTRPKVPEFVAEIAQLLAPYVERIRAELRAYDHDGAWDIVAYKDGKPVCWSCGRDLGDTIHAIHPMGEAAEWMRGCVIIRVCVRCAPAAAPSVPGVQ